MRAAVAATRRFPVKSLQGPAVHRLRLGPHGVEGDRRLAIEDVATGKLATGKRFRQLLLAAADDERIVLPDGRVVPLEPRPAAEAALGAWLGREVRLVDAGTPRPFDVTLGPPDDEGPTFEIPTPAASLVDLAAVHVLSTASLAAGAAARPDLDWSPERFRPNLLVEGDLEPFGEDAWAGRRLRVGGAVLQVDQPTLRCSLVLRATPTGPAQPALHGALQALHGGHLGVYCSVVEPGEVAVGDPVELA